MDENKPTAISVKNVTKMFRLPHEKQTSIKGLFVNIFRNKRTFEKQRVLNGITFEIKKGEFFGIVGRNGSGKSTLLKILAGIYTPNSGSVKINGKLTPFIELGVGFNPELTGRENVYLNGALLGIGRKEMNEIYEDIVAFAELEQFMDQKLKNYSSGMQVRLAFSIAIRAKGDILLLDEVLAVGDAAFQKKCLEYFNQLKKNKQTVILVTHDMNSVERFCDRAMLIESGEIKIDGKSNEVARRYEEMFIREELKRKKPNDGQEDLYALDSLKIIDAQIMQNEKKQSRIKAYQPFTLKLTLKSNSDITSPILSFNIKNYEGRVVLATDTLMHTKNLTFSKNKSVNLEMEVENILTNGIYTVNISGADLSEQSKVILQRRALLSFMVEGVEKYRDSLVHPKIKVKANQS